jgi:hypothetical protein
LHPITMHGKIIVNEKWNVIHHVDSLRDSS